MLYKLDELSHIVSAYLERRVDKEVGDITVACNHAANKAVEHVRVNDRILVNINESALILDFMHELIALFYADNRALGGLDSLVGKVDQLLGLTCSLDADNKFNHNNPPIWLKFGFPLLFTES